MLSEKEWTRRTEWVWATDRWRKVDLSTMETWVVIKADDKTANYYGCYLVKDHLNGGRMTVKVDPTRGKPANWNQVVLLSKLYRRRPVGSLPTSLVPRQKLFATPFPPW